LLAFTLGGLLYRLRASRGVPPDEVDIEGLADLAIIALRDGARRIESSPAAWYASRQHAPRRDPLYPSPSARGGDGGPELVRTRLARAAGFSAINEADIEPTVLLDEIGALPPSLQLTAALLLAERWTRREICERLGISRVRLRKRIERIGKHLETRRRSSKDYR
jgi:hypothetical protein